MKAKDLLEKINSDIDKSWYSLGDLAGLTGENPNDIEKMVNKSSDFVRSSSKLSEDGEPLYTTKKEFKEKASFGQKILGAFRNRID